MKVCTNLWSMKDREYWSKKAKNILGEYYSKLLLRDEIPPMEYDAIKDILDSLVQHTADYRTKR